MIGHIVDRNKLLTLIRHNSGHVFLKLVLVRSVDKTLATFDREDNMDVELGEGVGQPWNRQSSYPNRIGITT